MKAAMILNGCVHQDGNEIKTVLSILCLKKANFDLEFFSFNEDQNSVINHNNNKEVLYEKKHVI